jgi:hypothetical protein
MVGFSTTANEGHSPSTYVRVWPCVLLVVFQPPELLTLLKAVTDYNSVLWKTCYLMALSLPVPDDP